jgi:hypothetical protein
LGLNPKVSAFGCGTRLDVTEFVVIELEMLVVEDEVGVRSGFANGGEIPVQVLLPA